MRAFRTLNRFEPRGADSLVRWLAGIARHVILERSRRLRHETNSGVEEPRVEGPSASENLRRHERLERLQAALDGLPEHYRNVLRSVFVERLPVAEVARRTGRTPNAVSLILLRANRKLRESFGDTNSLELPDGGLDWGRSNDTA